MKKVTLLLALLLIGLVAVPSNAQSTLFALFLGQENGHTQLYRVSLDGTVTPLSSAYTGDVLFYDADASAAAFVERGGDGALTLHTTDLGTLATTSAPLSVTLPTGLVLTREAINLLARNTADKPSILTFNRTTLAPIADHAAQRSDSAFTVQAGGKWVMAYNPSGALDVFSLPTLTEANFDLVDFAYSTPAWSPAKGQLQFIGSTAKQNDRFIYMVDFDAATSKRFPLADASTTQQSQWSDHGRYIITSNRQESGTLVFTDVNDGSQKTLSEPGFILVPLGWSFDDSWLLYSAQISASSPVDFFAYDTTTQESHPLHNLSNTPITAHWSSDSNQLMVIAQGQDQSIGVYTVTAPAFDSWQPLLPSVDGQIAQSSVKWVGTTVLIEYGGTLLTLDTSTRAALRLSPQSISVVPGSMQLIG